MHNLTVRAGGKGAAVWLSLVASLLVSACVGTTAPQQDGRILVIGDSVLDMHSAGGAAISDVVADRLGMVARNESVSGARLSSTSPEVAARGGDIRQQYVAGDWDWVLLNGGANDLLWECGCNHCSENLDGMITPDGQRGDIPVLVRNITKSGARVMLLGYYRGNEKPNPFSICTEEVGALNARLARFAAETPGVYYVAAADVIDPANPRHWYFDRVHPSRLGSRLIGEQVAKAMETAG